MKGFVLAAGFGTRLAPLSEQVPKPLFPVGQVPLIGYALELLAAHGITEVGVNVHHLAKQLKDRLGTGEQFGVSITYSHEEEILGTGGGLKQMQGFFGDDPFVVLNSDTLIDVDLTAVIQSHRQAGAISTMVLRRDPEQEAYGQIELDSSQRIRRILGQGASDLPLQPYMFSGVHVMESRFLEYLPPGVKTCVNRYGYTKALANDEVLHGYRSDGAWKDFGTPSRYFDGIMALIDGRDRWPTTDGRRGTVEREPGVWVAEDAQCDESVSFSGPSMVCSRAKLAPKVSLGGQVYVGEGAHIGRGAHLERCVVMPGAKIAPDLTVRGKLVGKKGEIELDDAP